VLNLLKHWYNYYSYMWHVYMILCEDDSIYTGVTDNIERRLKEHRTSQGSKHTRDHGFEKLLYTEKYKTRSEARDREKQIKGWRREKKISLAKHGHPDGRD
jgi:predicted GIY-YIG superfamily endonuclease